MDNGWSWFATPQGARELLRIGRCPHTTWNIQAGACDSCAIAIISAAVHEDRASIVEWLRVQAIAAHDLATRPETDTPSFRRTLARASAFANAADAIEAMEDRPCPAK